MPPPDGGRGITSEFIVENQKVTITNKNANKEEPTAARPAAINCTTQTLHCVHVMCANWPDNYLHTGSTGYMP